MQTFGSNLVRDALAACRRHFIFAACFSGLINLLYLAPAIFMLQVYDRVVPTRGTPTLVLLLLVLTFALAVLAILDLARMRLLQRASVRLERRTAGPLLVQALGSGSAPASARLQALRDFEVLRGSLSGAAVIALFDAPWAPVYILVSFLLHPLLGALCLASAVSLAVVALVSERSTRQAVTVANARQSELSRLQEFSIHASETARALGMRGGLVARQLSERAGVVQLQADLAGRSGGFLAATKFLRLLLQSVALAVGAWLAVNGAISAGAIFASALLLGRALQPIEQILGGLKNLLSARESHKNLLAFCDAAPLDLNRTSLPEPEGRLEVECVSVVGAARDRNVLNQISFRADPGELVALVGPSGSGKTTLLRLLAGAMQSDAGEVRLDGARHCDWDSDRLGRHIGYMAQDTLLFPDTVRANICRFANYVEADHEAIDARVVEAAKLAGAHDLILRLQKGYDTDLRSAEGMLSAGQRQLIALARALYGSPRFIFLDEPNAHLDGEGDAQLLGAFGELKQRGSTLIVSTHRTGVLQVADKVLLLLDGSVQAFGDRDEILRGKMVAVGAASQSDRLPETRRAAA